MTNNKTYRDMQADLDELTTQLQSPDVGIDEALELYKKGQKLIGQIEEYLQAAKNEIEHLKL